MPGTLEGLGLNGTLFFETIVPLGANCPIFLMAVAAMAARDEMGATLSVIAKWNIRGRYRALSRAIYGAIRAKAECAVP